MRINLNYITKKIIILSVLLGKEYIEHNLILWPAERIIRVNEINGAMIILSNLITFYSIEYTACLLLFHPSGRL